MLLAVLLARRLHIIPRKQFRFREVLLFQLHSRQAEQALGISLGLVAALIITVDLHGLTKRFLRLAIHVGPAEKFAVFCQSRSDQNGFLASRYELLKEFPSLLRIDSCMNQCRGREKWAGPQRRGH